MSYSAMSRAIVIFKAVLDQVFLSTRKEPFGHEGTTLTELISLEQKVMNRWIIVVGAILIQLCLGAIYAWSVFTPPLVAPLADEDFVDDLGTDIVLVVDGELVVVAKYNFTETKIKNGEISDLYIDTSAISAGDHTLRLVGPQAVVDELIFTI